MSNPQYRVFRKTFHVPSKWLDSEQLADLVEHKYVLEEWDAALRKVTDTLGKLGYTEDNDSMVHDYLLFMVEDLLDKNGEVFITEDDIRNNSRIRNLLAGLTPDLVIKKNTARDKTVIIDVYVGTQQADTVKSKYKTLGFFLTLRVVTPQNFQQQLLGVLPESDVDYLYKNFQLFLTEHSYWRACIKLRHMLHNDVENVPLQEIKLAPPRLAGQVAAKIQFKKDLAQFAERVADQKMI